MQHPKQGDNAAKKEVVTRSEMKERKFWVNRKIISKQETTAKHLHLFKSPKWNVNWTICRHISPYCRRKLWLNIKEKFRIFGVDVKTSVEEIFRRKSKSNPKLETGDKTLLQFNHWREYEPISKSIAER